MRHWIVVPAAGSGRRFGGGVPKQYLELGGRPVIVHALERLLRSDPAGLVVVLAPGDEHWPRLTGRDDPRILTAVGGVERVDSVRAGLALLAGRAAPEDPVLVHDAVRPCVALDDIRALLAAADHPGGAVLAVPVADTLKRVDDSGRVAATEPRAGLWAAQTPQLCRYGVLVAALAAAGAGDAAITDEAAALEAAGHRPRVVPGRRDNIKITWPADLALAAAILAAQEGGVKLRVGHGYDVHRFGPGDHVVLAGVRIAHSAGVIAHSDGDVLIHALCDALFGAAALGDIGRHFPDTDPRYRGADSRILLRRAMALLHAQRWELVNADLTLIAEAPRVAPHHRAMIANLCGDLGVGEDRINIKGTTTEGLGFAGRREGIACHAVVLIAERETPLVARPAPEAGFDLAFPRALGPPVCTGRLRVVPEDFAVEELLPADFAFSGAGEHLCLEIRKRGENSRWVARRLAVATGVAETDVGFCGLKDRHAVTTQWFSVPVRGDAAPELEGLDAEILSCQRHRAKLRRGMHAGNRFRIRLREVGGDREAIAARLARIAQGVPNYFGPQRFGSAGNNLAAAQQLIATARIRGGGRNGLYLSAARSWLFNLVLAARVRDGTWNRPLDGEIRPEGPLWGRGRSPAAPAAAAVEAEALADWQAWCHALEHAGLRQERRALVLIPEAFSWHWQDADLVLEFRLGRGEFATALLAELGEFAAP